MNTRLARPAGRAWYRVDAKYKSTMVTPNTTAPTTADAAAKGQPADARVPDCPGRAHEPMLLCRGVELAELGAAGPKDMGRVMAALKERHAGQMDFGRASGVVKSLLS